MILGLLLCGTWNVSAQYELPRGSNPTAIEFEHFPSRLHAFVWRNWNLVETSKLASILECQGSQVAEIARSMGLEAQRKIPSSHKQQLYITIIRRNWHLLPYDQLVDLLDMEVEELFMALKEDDFLFHKLGSLKPKCDSLKYHTPGRGEIKRAAEIKEIVNTYFDQTTEAEPRFGFISDLNKSGTKTYQKSDNEEGLRYIYSYFGVFGDPLMNPELDPYPEGLLEKLSIQGVNGIWIHVVLNQLCRRTAEFPELGEGSEVRLENLKKIVDRAAKYGIKVYLYMNEPRAMPENFFDDRSEIAGVMREGFRTMCTSTPIVQDWIRNSLSHVFREVPGLGGVFTISASENLTNCASHRLQENCSRCSQREYSEIIAEVNKVIAEGVHAVAPDAKVIVWDWGWYGHGDATEIIERLPEDVWFMSVSEWALPISRGGVNERIGEYSISAVGPGPRALRHWDVASGRKLNTVAKVQFNNTWELSAVPWIPVLNLVAQHARNLATSGVDGYMLSWSLGGYPSPNLEVAKQFSADSDQSIDDVLNKIAIERYGQMGAPFARKAWKLFSGAFEEFPYNGSVVYRAPQQYGPANLLYAKPTGYASTMVGFPYDDLEGWRGSYPANVLLGQFRKVAQGWERGLQEMEKIPGLKSGMEGNTARFDYGIAKAVYLHFASVANQIVFILHRDGKMDDIEGLEKRTVSEILESEIELARELYKLTKADSRIGFEATNQYYYLPRDLMEKAVNCAYILGE